MKKVYSKPEIMFEDFSLNNSITVNCEKIAQAAEYECSYKVHTSDGTMNIFTSSAPRVCTDVEADGAYNGICYHVPTEANNVFTS